MSSVTAEYSRHHRSDAGAYRRTRSLVRTAEKAFVVFALFLFSDALIPQLRRVSGYAGGETEGDPAQQVFWFLIYVVSIIAITRAPQQFVRTLKRDKWLLALTALAFGSVVWSPAPMVTLRHCVGLVGTIAFATYVASRFELEETLEMTAWALGIVAAMSILFVIAIPELGVHQGDRHDGLWRGVFTGKNHLGRIMALYGIVCFSLLRSANGRRKVPYYAGLLIAAFLAFEAQSMTALAVMSATTAAIGVFLILRLRPLFLVPAFAMICALLATAGLTIWNNHDSILLSVGRDLTLTGRTVLWSALMERIGERPWLGYGFGTFWIGTPETSGPVWAISYAMNQWEPVSAHNGFLELALGVGVIGLVVFLVGALRLASLSFNKWKQNPHGLELWPLIFLVTLALVNLGETSLFRQNNIYWVLYIITALSMSSSVRTSPVQLSPNDENEQNRLGRTPR